MKLQTFLSKQFILYGIVGIFGMVVDISVFFFCIHLGFPIIIAQWISAFSGFLHNHFWHHFHVFSHTQKLKKTLFYSSILTIIIIALSGPLLQLIYALSLNILLSKLLVLVLSVFASFFIRRKYVFISSTN